MTVTEAPGAQITGTATAVTSSLGPNSSTAYATTFGVLDIQTLTIPTYEGSGVCTHPSVVCFDKGWNGYRYWMAFTPYPSENPDFENPSIVASQDGTTWVVPVGLTNPIEPYPGALSFNSDTHLTYAADGYLYCFWRTYENSQTEKERLYYRRSSDGVTWGSKTLVRSSDHTVQRLVSPAFIQESNGSWRFYAVDIVPATNTIVTSTAATLAGPWSAATAVTGVTVGAGRDFWHLDAKRIGGEYVILVDDTALGVSGTAGNLYRAVSRDGATFVTDSKPFAAASTYYRTSFLPATVNGASGYETFYSTIGTIQRGFVVADAATPAQDAPVNMLLGALNVAPFVFGDRVDRADSAVSPGVASSGQTWAALGGTWGVSSNNLYVTTSTNGKVNVDIGAADFEYGFTVSVPPPTGGSLYLMARLSDTNNYWRLGSTAGTWAVQSIEAGAIVVSLSVPGRNLVAGDTLRVVCSGTSIKMFVNGFQVLATTSATFQTATKVGVQSSRLETRVGKFYARTV